MLRSRPTAAEHAPYYGKYIDAAERAVAAQGGAALPDLLAAQPAALRALLRGVDDGFARRAYAPGKWTLLESLLHVSDTERVFSYRMLRVARGDSTPLPGFEQDDWVPLSGANARTLSDILTELDLVRGATLALVRSLDDAAFARIGTASGNTVSARALVWIIAGHFAHHLDFTRDRYLGLPAAS